MQPKIQEYLSIGVEWIWLVDPEDRKAISYSPQNPAGSLCDVLRTANPEIEIPLASVFEV
jgi:Uma2 family endonuclease